MESINDEEFELKDFVTEEENNLENERFEKIDLYSNEEYLSAISEAQEYENSEVMMYYKNTYCLNECLNNSSQTINNIKNSYDKIKPYIINSLDEIISKRQNMLCVLNKGHEGKCCYKVNLFKKNDTTDKLNKSIKNCIFDTPGNDAIIFKNRSSRLFPIILTKKNERKIKEKIDKKKLNCAIPLREYSTPFMIATAYIDWMCYILNVSDILEHIKYQENYINLLKNDHRIFLENEYLKYGRKIFNTENNILCAIKKNLITTKNISDESRDNRIDISVDDIQMGHVISKSDYYFATRGLNILMMTRDGNRILGEYNYLENEWIEQLKNIISHYY
jgi:hypothetical protein